MVKYIHSDKWTAKQNYVENIMRENSEVETLTEEQHEALQELARIRHEIHSSWETMWNDEASDNPRLWNYIESGIDEMLTEAELPTIEFNYEPGDIPTAEDYYIFLTEEEQEEYDNDSWKWREESGAFDEFADFLSEVNNKIEDYLRNIDKEYGTHYAPTGFARLK